MSQEDTVVKPTNDTKEFKFMLNGTEDLEQRLVSFKKACDAHEKHRLRKRCKKRYYNLGLIAKIVPETTDEELRRLLKNGTRTFMFDTVISKTSEVEKMLAQTNMAIEAYQRDEMPIIKLVTGLAFEITGDACRLGRFRNNCSVLLQRCDIIILTIDESYRYSCFREIAYVINLKYYLNTLNLNDIIRVGKDVSGKVIKKLKDNISVVVDEGGLLNSYDYIELPNQCYTLKQEIFPDLFGADLDFVSKSNANYIVMPKIRCKPFLKALCQSARDNYKLKIIGAIDLEFISSKMLDLLGIVKMLDYLWIPDMFTVNRCIQCYIYQDVIPIAKCLKIPIIGTIPLEKCSDFKRFENHEFLWKIDAMFIEKSPWCQKYPLIVKKLLPIKDFRMGITENTTTLKNILTSYQSIVNFIIRTICSIECQAIIIYSKCQTAAEALGRTEIYCPVFVMLPINNEDTEEETTCKLDLARSLNFRRNLRGVFYSKELNECNLGPIEYGIEFARKIGCLETGDFIITLEVCKEDEEDIEYGVGEDVVILRCFYLPPPKIADKFKFC